MRGHTRAQSSDALAPEIEAVIARVVGRARLRRGEREDVARELATHFAAGMAEGKSAAEVVGEFGDVKAAGKMIGRAKRRCRGVVWQAWVWSCRGVMGLFALVVVLYGWAAWGYYGASPTITRNYLKEMNAKVEAIPEEDRAWPVYREALLKSSHQDLDRLIDFAYDPQIDASEWAELEDIVSRNEESTALILRGSARPALGLQVSADGEPDLSAWRGLDAENPGAPVEDPENPPHWAVDVWPVSALRGLAFLLLSDARVAIAKGDEARWRRDIVAGMRMADQAGGSSRMLDYLVAVSLHQMLQNRVGEELALHPDRISEESLGVIAHELESSLGWKREIPYEDAKRDAEDSIQRLYNASTGRITAEGVEQLAAHHRSFIPINEESKKTLEPPVLRGPVNAMVMATRDEALARIDWMFDSWDRRAHTPLLQRGKDEVRTWVDEEPILDVFKIRWWPVFAGSGLGFGTEKIMDRMMMQTEALEVAIAIELFRRHEGRLPASLDELAPRYLPKVPIDIYSGEELRYIVRDGVPVVYSVGCDMDDDGARQPLEEFGRYAVSAAADGPPRATDPDWWTEERIRGYDGDWTLWPWFNRDTDEFECAPR